MREATRVTALVLVMAALLFGGSLARASQRDAYVIMTPAPSQLSERSLTATPVPHPAPGARPAPRMP